MSTQIKYQKNVLILILILILMLMLIRILILMLILMLTVLNGVGIRWGETLGGRQRSCSSTTVEGIRDTAGTRLLASPFRLHKAHKAHKAHKVHKVHKVHKPEAG